MKITEVKNMFPFDKVEVYHKILGYAIPVDEIPEIIKNATVTHCSIIGDAVVAYCEG